MPILADRLDREHLLSLFQQSPGFLCFLRGPDFVFELANPAYYQTVGHREILGKPIREALPELEGQGFLELLERVYRTNEPFVGHAMPVRLQREQNAVTQPSFVEFVYQPIANDGGVIGILVHGYEVTEAKRQEARYRTLFESLDDGYCLMQMIVEDGKTVDYRFLETNPMFEAQTGLAGALGRTARELVPDLDASWFERYGHVAETGEPLRFESHAPAMKRWFEVFANRVGDPSLRQVALVFKDVSERKRAEEERERLLALESAARKQAEESSLLKDEFLATVSHELRTPLSAILGWVQLLRAGNLAPEKATRALETIERNARAQSQLIEDLLDVSRILSGKLRLELGVVFAEPFLEAALETVRPAAEKKGLLLTATLEPALAVVADASRMQQVIVNLLSNAVKFTPESGSIRLDAKETEGALEITVTDTGEGIASEFVPHVFERFRQAQGGANRRHGGLGLGLSIVRQLVEMHGGSVKAESAGRGAGASFTVRLPLAARTQSKAFTTPLPRPIGNADELAGVRVLVVDDDDDTREILASLLGTAGASCVTASSVTEGMDRLRAAPVDLVFSDIGMPDEDGYAFIAKIRGMEGLRDLPVVAVTAFTRAEDRTRALMSGFDNYIGKPIEPLELVAVAKALSSRRR